MESDRQAFMVSPLISSCVVLSKLLNISEPLVAHLKKILRKRTHLGQRATMRI